ncbi:hypothetical protein BH24ACT23_BH24ACT23_08020 [soil metagenome]
MAWRRRIGENPGVSNGDQHAQPQDIWRETVNEGERRLTREPRGLAATGLVGGLDVMLGLTAVIVLTGAVATITNPELAHVVGSLAFGIALVFVVIGRSELFTENFLVPVGAVYSGRGSRTALARMWSLTLLSNLVGLAIVAAILSIDGVVPPGALDAAGELAKTIEDRNLAAALGSAVIAGLVMTLFTWVALAVGSDGARIALALLIGFLLLGPSLNHAVVSFGEMLIAAFSGTTDMGVAEIAFKEVTAIVGNLAGGLAFVTATRVVQVRGESG